MFERSQRSSNAHEEHDTMRRATHGSSQQQSPTRHPRRASPQRARPRPTSPVVSSYSDCTRKLVLLCSAANSAVHVLRATTGSTRLPQLNQQPKRRRSLRFQNNLLDRKRQITHRKRSTSQLKTGSRRPMYGIATTTPAHERELGVTSSGPKHVAQELRVTNHWSHKRVGKNTHTLHLERLVNLVLGRLMEAPDKAMRTVCRSCLSHERNPCSAERRTCR